MWSWASDVICTNAIEAMQLSVVDKSCKGVSLAAFHARLLSSSSATSPELHERPEQPPKAQDAHLAGSEKIGLPLIALHIHQWYVLDVNKDGEPP